MPGLSICGARVRRSGETAAHVRFEVPDASERPARLSSVLEVIYLIFNEGYSATPGDDWMRPALCAEAVRLARVLAQLAPAEAEVQGLVALLEIQASRIPARTDSAGAPVLLLDQDRSRWDRLLINRGLAALHNAIDLGGERGPYALQAAIAACHARAFRAEETDWARIVALYGVLAVVMPSPVVELDRAAAEQDSRSTAPFPRPCGHGAMGEPFARPDGLDRLANIVLAAAAGTVGLIKPQSAFFERHGWRGDASDLAGT